MEDDVLPSLGWEFAASWDANMEAVRGEMYLYNPTERTLSPGRGVSNMSKRDVALGHIKVLLRRFPFKIGLGIPRSPSGKVVAL